MGGITLSPCRSASPRAHHDPTKRRLHVVAVFCSGFTKRVMVIYNGVHYDALAISNGPRTAQEEDVTEFNPRTKRGKQILAAAQKLVGFFLIATSTGLAYSCTLDHPHARGVVGGYIAESMRMVTQTSRLLPARQGNQAVCSIVKTLNSG